jgi:selenocysteine lyase/cysteine desulfurase
MSGAAGTVLALGAASTAGAEAAVPDLSYLAQPDSDEAYWKMVRLWFPLNSEKIYFNNGGLGPSPYYVLETVQRKTMELEIEGEHGHQLVHEVNEKAARLLHADVSEIALTRNTTEGMNIIARGLPLKKGDEILTSTHEHVGGVIPWLGLVNDVGVKINLFEPALTAAENLTLIESNLTKKTRVVSLSHITCTTGQQFPVKEIAKLLHARNIIFVLDGAHPPGMIPVDLHEIGCDFYATSGHKWLMGPKETGLLYISQNMFDVWRPTYVGAYSEDGTFSLKNRAFHHRREASATEYGTRNTALALGFGAAFDFINLIGQEKIAKYGQALADHLRKSLHENFSNIEILTPEEAASNASIISFRFPATDSNLLQDKIQKAGNIRLRGVSENDLNAIRVSLHVYNNFKEIDVLVDTMKNVHKG